MKPLDKEIMYHFQSLGMESFGDSALKENFKRAFNPGLFTQLKRRLKVIFGPRIASQFQVTNSVSLKTEKWMDEQGYVSIGDITVYVPKGLNVPYLTYMDSLEESLYQVSLVHKELLIPFSNTILTLINNPSMLNAASGIDPTLINGTLTQSVLETLLNSLSKCKEVSKKNDTAPFKNIFARNSDLGGAITRQLAIQDGCIRLNFKDLEKTVETLFTHANKLATLINEDPDYSNVSKNSANQISEALYNCARWVEFLGIYINEVIVSSNALGDTVTKLDKIAKA